MKPEENTINLIKISLIVLLATFIFYNIAESQKSDFTILEDEKTKAGPQIDPHLEFLGLGLRYPAPVSVVPFWRRMPEIETPGDYFRHPEGASVIELTDKDISEIINTLKDLIIEDKFYDSHVLGNLKGYQYDMKRGKIRRREYYVRYARGDTIFVISGLLGKFLSFYVAVPGKERLSIDELKQKVKVISPVVNFEGENGFVEKENKFIYFIEYIDRNRKMRLRNYQIIGNADNFFSTGDPSRIEDFYNLIEITRFLDEEAIP